MKKIILGMLVVGLLVLAGCAQETKTYEEGMTTFKSANCGCCGIWTQYAEKEGFDVDIKTTENMDMIKDRYNIPQNLRSCHTTEVGEYFVEGHVPVEAVDKLLSEQPDIAGIALPGMPSGSPGMPGPKTGVWTIYAINHDGSVEEFMTV